MKTIGFIGLGNMGGPMAANLVKAGYAVTGFDPVDAARAAAVEAGVVVAASAAEAVGGAEVVITMLPSGRHVLDAYEGADGLLASAPPGALFGCRRTLRPYARCGSRWLGGSCTVASRVRGRRRRPATT